VLNRPLVESLLFSVALAVGLSPAMNNGLLAEAEPHLLISDPDRRKHGNRQNPDEGCSIRHSAAAGMIVRWQVHENH
jgi:hypothetical protein